MIAAFRFDGEFIERRMAEHRKWQNDTANTMATNFANEVRVEYRKKIELGQSDHALIVRIPDWKSSRLVTAVEVAAGLTENQKLKEALEQAAARLEDCRYA